MPSLNSHFPAENIVVSEDEITNYKQTCIFGDLQFSNQAPIYLCVSSGKKEQSSNENMFVVFFETPASFFV